ncbi:MAG TPA: serine/threonine-protein kinase [Pyrinomonadaceae bacterium]|nr:serine/threonine-protein kinase [Pyrinomonadaceae bacterium]
MALSNLIGQVLDGKYRIEEQLGKGGMGAVYYAIHLGTERPVALKVIAPQLMQHDEFVERFRREARAAGRLRHPNVVDVTDFGFTHLGDERIAYLVMEYLDGYTLNEILQEESTLPLNWVIDIMEQTCSAVEAAHQQGIVHRDLKPDNIWLEPNHRGSYTIKVLDFGIAKLDDPKPAPAPDTSEPATIASEAITAVPGSETSTLMLPGSKSTADNQLEAATQISPSPVTRAHLDEADIPPTIDFGEAGTRALPAPQTPSAESIDEGGTRLFKRTTDDHGAAHTASSSSLTRVGSILGTPLYMSPEQCRGQSLDARSDIYSLGVVAYRLLSGETPFSGDHAKVLKMHRETPPPPLAVKRVPKKVAALVMSALAKNPDERPSSAAGFAGALRAHATGVGTLLRNALTLYTEHLPTFMRLALLVYAPVVFVTLLKVTFMFLVSRHMIGKPWDVLSTTLTNVLGVLVTFLSASVVGGITAWLVSQLLAVPLRPLLLRPAFDHLRQRWWPYMWTGLAASLLAVIGLGMCVLPGLYAMANLCMVGPVLMMEELRGRAAMKRSRELYKRSRKTVIAIVLIHISVPVFVNVVAGVLLVAIAKALNPADALRANSMITIVQQLVQVPITILFSSLASVVTALLYWKLRLAGGETLKQSMVQFDHDAPDATGYKRPRTRTRTSMRTDRSGSRGSSFDRST